MNLIHSGQGCHERKMFSSDKEIVREILTHIKELSGSFVVTVSSPGLCFPVDIVVRHTMCVAGNH